MRNIKIFDATPGGALVGIWNPDIEDYDSDIVPNNEGFLKSLFSGLGGDEPEITEDFIRIPINNAARDETISLDTFSKKDGIYFIRHKAAEGISPVVDYVFDTEKWNKKQAAEWVIEHKPKSGGIAFIKAYGDPGKSKFYQAKAGEYDEKADNPDEDIWIFEGYSSTNDVDRANEIVDPKAFKKYLKRYLINPIVLFMHQWGGLPIGRVLELEIRDKGLWVRIMISKTAETVWTLIKEKVLRAMSIGFDLHEWKDQEGGPRILTVIELLENSLVNVPMDPFAVGQAAKSLGVNIGNLKPHFSNEEEKMYRFMLKNYDKGDGGGGTPDPNPQSVDVAEIVKVTVRESLKGITDMLVEAHERSTSEFSEKVAKAQSDFLERLTERDKKLAEKQIIPGTGRLDLAAINPAPGLKHIKIRDENEFYIKVLNKRLPGIPDREQRMIDEIKDLNDAFYTAFHFGNAYCPGFDIKNHPDYEYYKSLKMAIKAAMDTETSGEGSEWVGTGYSSRLYEKVKLELKIAGLFETIPMPMPTFYLPTDMTEDIGYLIPQSLQDIASKIPSIDPDSAQVLLTAKKFGARIVSSMELVEDALFAILPMYQRKVVRALARAIETSLVNGDDSTTHFDTGYTVAATDARRAYKGIRKLNSSASAETDLSTFNADSLRSIRKSMGPYAIDPKQLAWITGLKIYIKMLSMKDDQNNPVLTTLEKWGPQATFKTGTLAVFDGAPVVVSEFMYENLNASGIYDGVTETYGNVLLANIFGYVAGERRIVKVGQKDDIETDQKIVVATQRRAFVKVTSSALYPSWTGYKITP